MFVINFKLDAKKIIFSCILIAGVIATIIEFSNKDIKLVDVNADTTYDYIFTEENYTTLLNQIHSNIDASVGKTVKISGFVYTMPDFKENYFVCGRNVIENSQDKVAGFLCKSEEKPKLQENEWVEITGIIIKGDYNGQMPIIKVGSLNKIVAPANTFVEDKTNNEGNNS